MFGAFNKEKLSWKAPHIPKSSEDTEALSNYMSKSFIFAYLNKEDFNTVLGAFDLKTVKEKTNIITQGDNGDFLYVINLVCK